MNAQRKGHLMRSRHSKQPLRRGEIIGKRAGRADRETAVMANRQIDLSIIIQHTRTTATAMAHQAARQR